MPSSRPTRMSPPPRACSVCRGITCAIVYPGASKPKARMEKDLGKAPPRKRVDSPRTRFQSPSFLLQAARLQPVSHFSRLAYSLHHEDMDRLNLWRDARSAHGEERKNDLETRVLRNRLVNLTLDWELA